jgi:hypothetical protein
LPEAQHIRSLVRQATVYRAQGLYAESRAKYEEILSLLGSSHQFQNVEKLAEAVRKRLENVEWDIQQRDLRDKALERSEKADYWEFSDDCTGTVVSWIRNAVSWTRKRVTKRRLPGELPGKRRIWS